MIPYAPITRRPRIPNEADKLLDELTQETMTRAWGERTHQERVRIATAALIFGEEFEHRAPNLPETTAEPDVQRFLMTLMSAVVQEFARRESLPPEEAASFLSEVGTRDRILEFNEVLSARAEDPERPLDALLSRAVDARKDKSIWARHFKSG